MSYIPIRRPHLLRREIRRIRRCNKRLDVFTADEGEERSAAVGVKLTHHIVEQQDRCLAYTIPQVEELREFERERSCTLLSLRAVTTQTHAADKKNEIVKMRSHARRPARNIADTAFDQRLIIP